MSEPQKYLKEIRKLIDRYYTTPPGSKETDNILEKLAGNVDALDKWMIRGGFSPWESEVSSEQKKKQ